MIYRLNRVGDRVSPLSNSEYPDLIACPDWVRMLRGCTRMRQAIEEHRDIPSANPDFWSAQAIVPSRCCWTAISWRGSRPTNDISIELKIQWNFQCFSSLFIPPITTNFFLRHDSDTVVECAKFLEIGWACYKKTGALIFFYRISNSIEISLVGREPGFWLAGGCAR